MKRFILLISIACFSIGVFAQGTKASTQVNQESKVEIFCGVPKAPPAIPILRMIETGVMNDVADLSYEIWNTPEQLIAMIQGSDANMFALPLTVVSKLYNKGIPIKLTNVNTWGVIYFTTTDPSFSSWKDLRGKTVYIPLRSSPPDYLTQYFLTNAGLKIGEDVEIVYSTQTEIANLMIAGKIKYATMIEPQVTQVQMKNNAVRVAFCFEEIWKEIYGDKACLPNAGFGGKSDFLTSNPNLVSRFEEEYQKAIEWSLNNPKKAGLLAERELGINAQVIEKALPKMGLKYMSAQDSSPYLEQFYELLYSFNPTSIGGKIADSGMLYDKEI